MNLSEKSAVRVRGSHPRPVYENGNEMSDFLGFSPTAFDTYEKQKWLCFQ